MAKNTNSMMKTVFFIVEGNTDKTAMQNIFKKIYRDKNIRYEFTNGDITSDENVNKDNILDIIYGTISPYMKEYSLRKSDVWQIVQVFDMDGAYVPSTAIVQGNTKEFAYTSTTVSCTDISKIERRNAHKTELMNYLLEQHDIKSIPYRCFFMSSNLDHALYGEQNLTDEQKKDYAHAFYKLFEGKEMAFIEYLSQDVVNGVPNSYPGSWKYIKEDLHSLERHSNLHIYFIENPIM